jgi:cytochrome b pre-mRNA-processing protein 3
MQRQIQSSLRSRVPSPSHRLAQALKNYAPSVTNSYTIYGQTEALLISCSTAADYTIPRDMRMNVLTGKGPAKEESQGGAELGQPLPENAEGFWFRDLALPPTFSTWSQVSFLHMYVLITQLRGVLGTQSEFQDYHRYIIEHFSRAAEDKMVILHNMNAQGIRSRYLKDIFLQWRGVLASYDEGLVKGDSVLGSAIWRNLFRGDKAVDWVRVALVTGWVRYMVNKVGAMSMDDVLRTLGAKRSLWEMNVDDRKLLRELVAMPVSVAQQVEVV